MGTELFWWTETRDTVYTSQLALIQVRYDGMLLSSFPVLWRLNLGLHTRYLHTLPLCYPLPLLIDGIKDQLEDYLLKEIYAWTINSQFQCIHF